MKMCFVSFLIGYDSATTLNSFRPPDIFSSATEPRGFGDCTQVIIGSFCGGRIINCLGIPDRTRRRIVVTVRTTIVTGVRGMRTLIFIRLSTTTSATTRL